MTNVKTFALVSLIAIALLAYIYLNPVEQKATTNALATESTTSTFVNQQTTYVPTTTAGTQTIESANYSIYIPQDMDYKVGHPLVVALSPSADAASMISAWKNVADRHQWIVYASKTFKNGQDVGPEMQLTMSDVTEVEKDYPVDRSRIIFTGFSGGAQGSHMFAFYYPQTIWAIVLNTGMIQPFYYQNETILSYYPRNKTAAFIASPTDFRYEQMKKDKELLDGLGWRTKWIEFVGGHAIAPEFAYEEAAKWLENVSGNGPQKKIEPSQANTSEEDGTTKITQATGFSVEAENYTLYLPHGLDQNVKHPLLVALSPEANAASMIDTWRPIADKYRWIVYASKTFANGKCLGDLMNQILPDIEYVKSKYPVNKNRIIFAGFSGGAMGAHAMAYYRPATVWAVVANTGMIDELYYTNKSYLRYYPPNKTAVFLASPTDFRYEQMKKDKAFLDGRGWETTWIEFTGGHAIAPEETYQEAAQWLEDRMNTSRNPTGLVLRSGDL